MTAAGHGEKLGRCQERAIASLLLEGSIARAAKAAGVGEKTLSRWLRDPGFSAAYREARQQMLTASMGYLQQACAKAVKTLSDTMDNPMSPISSRVSAARVVLEMGFKAAEIEDLEARIAALEKGS